jgi:hypothetical protein
LSCHFFEFPALNVGALAVCMIEFCRHALLINPIALAFLSKPLMASALLAAISMSSITGAADIKQFAASRTSTNPLAQF